MAEIAHAAGMSVGHIYHYFDGKDKVIAALVAENVSRLAALMSSLESSSDPLHELLSAAPQWITECLDVQSARLQLEIAAEASRNPVIAAVVRDADHLAAMSFGKVLRAGRIKLGLLENEGLIRGRTLAIFALFEGLRVRSLHLTAADLPAVEQSIQLALKQLLYN
ncbi:TetR family transcriptional regulator [Pseudoduganella dura]|nr:TetR family transcriptional regulator [Pseudoduganella dura]